MEYPKILEYIFNEFVEIEAKLFYFQSWNKGLAFYQFF